MDSPPLLFAGLTAKQARSRSQVVSYSLLSPAAMLHKSHRLPGSASWTLDPATDLMLPIALAFLLFPALTLLYWLTPSLPGAWPVAVARAGLACSMAMLAGQAAQSLAISWRCWAAIKHLPAPNLPLFGIVGVMLSRRDVHRYITELAAEHGPIFRVHAAYVQHMVRRSLLVACCLASAWRR